MLETALSLATLYALCAFVVHLDRRHFGTFCTPTTLLLLPFAAVVSVHFLFGDLLGFVPLEAEVIIVWVVGSFIFWITGHALREIWVGRSLTHLPSVSPLDSGGSSAVTRWSVLGGSLALLLLAYAFVVLQQMGGLSAIASVAFKDQWGVGWGAHARIVVVVMLIFLLGSTKKWSALAVASLFLMILVVLLYRSKGALFAPLIAGSIFRVLSGTYAPKIRHLIWAVVGSFVLFQLVYLIGWATLDPSSLLDGEVYAFFSLHFMSYLFSGILGFSESLRLGVTWLNADGMLLLFAPFYNLFAVVFDFQLVMVGDLAQDHYVQTAAHGVGSNVNSFFGTIVLAIGPLHGIAAVVGVSLIAHAMFIGWTRAPNRWLLVAYSYWGSLLVFGWFEYYFWLLSCVEVPAICLLIGMVEKYLLPDTQLRPGNASTVSPVA
jgi:hypothetical protein